MQGDLDHLTTCWLFRKTPFTGYLNSVSETAQGSSGFQSWFEKSNQFYFSCAPEAESKS